MHRDTALILCSHGVNGAPGTAADHAARLRDRGLFADVAAACLNGVPEIVTTIDAATASHIIVVPFLMAAGRAFNTLLPARIARARHPERVSLADPVGTHPDIAALIESKAAALATARGWSLGQVQLVIAAHGTARDPASGVAARAHAMQIARSRQFAAVEAGYLDEAPSIASLLAGRTARHAIGVGLFADAGPHGGGDAAAPFRNDPDAAYAGPVGPDPALAGIVLMRAEEAIFVVSSND